MIKYLYEIDGKLQEIYSLYALSDDQKRKVTKVIIPHGYKGIAVDMFAGFDNLEQVDIADYVETILHSAFRDCVSLKELILPDSVTDIQDWAFANCVQLQKITLSKNITKIPSCMLNGCENLQQLTIPEGVTEIGYSAFRWCSSLQELTIPNSVTNIQNNAFNSCYKLKKINLPNTLTEISDRLFEECRNLQQITIPNSVTKIGLNAFCRCNNLTEISIPDSVQQIDENAFRRCEHLEKIQINIDLFLKNQECIKNQYKYMYVDCETNRLTFSNTIIEQLDKNKSCEKFEMIKDIAVNNYTNIINNLKICNQLKQQRKIKFIPAQYVLENFPYQLIENFYVNGNSKKWGDICKKSKFLNLDDLVKNNTLNDLFKIYYAIGGFSDKQEQVDKAYKYTLDYIIKCNDQLNTPKLVANDVHTRFSGIYIDNQYNEKFAQFFMRYYKGNKDFMSFANINGHSIDYLCSAHNKFDLIVDLYPNRVVSGNTQNQLLSPEFVKKACRQVKYSNVEQGNEMLAKIVGQYGYNQVQFDEIQNIFNTMKIQNQDFVIKANKSNDDNIVQYQLLDKNDELGFVLGDITNCCQHIGGVGQSCVIDGYTNPNAGFIIFTQNIENNNCDQLVTKSQVVPQQIIGQAYIWYDEQNKTVCFDNIEMPYKVIQDIRTKGYGKDKIQEMDMLCAIERAAYQIMDKMNEKEIKVKHVTVGTGYNDLNSVLHKKYGEPNSKPKAKPKEGVYTDAKSQYTIATYVAKTKQKEQVILDNISVIEKLQNKLKSHSITPNSEQSLI